jgi:hypothetical protein
MKYTRLIYHLAKGCPEMHKFDYEVCIYNWVHRVPKGSIDEHYKVCEFKPVAPKVEWNADLNMEIWNAGDWNSFLYDPAWPPEFFPDF